jgi:hypothetical protein
MEGFSNLTNAAREFIDERITTIEENAFGLYSEEDVASVHSEANAIEAEIGKIQCLVEAASALARMRHPSIEKLLRARGFGYEADRVAELVRTVDAAFKPAPANDAD